MLLKDHIIAHHPICFLPGYPSSKLLFCAVLSTFPWPRLNLLMLLSGTLDFLCLFVFNCCWVTKLWQTLCNPMDFSMPVFPVLHYIPECVQINVRWVNNTIQTSYLSSSPSPPALNIFQNQSFFPMSQLFTSGGQSIGASASASVPPINIQGYFL